MDDVFRVQLQPRAITALPRMDVRGRTAPEFSNDPNIEWLVRSTAISSGESPKDLAPLYLLLTEVRYLPISSQRMPLRRTVV